MSAHPLVTALMMRRLRLGKTQRAVAKAAGVSNATVCEVESGKVGPRLANFVKLADALDCDVVLVPRDRALRTEYAWVCEPPIGPSLPCLHRYTEETVRDPASRQGAVYVREINDWRAES